MVKKQRTARLVSLILVASLLLSTACYVSYATGARKSKAENTSEIGEILDGMNASGKEETVYVIADAEGTAKKVIVSDWLKNPDKAKHLNDRSDLKEIENVEGNETYSINKDNMKVWEADGKDIYYQGKTDKSLPVDLSISYKLDGKSISAKDLAGKSGKVTIRFDYQNNEYENVTINGSTQKIYVPFVMMTGTILDNKNFKNVQVTNGKIINDGGKSVVMGFAMPGLQENLNISKSQLDIPSYVEITADAKDFKLATTMTMASNEMFNDLDLSDVKSADDLKDKVNTFVSSAQQLTDGSSKLYDGLSTLMSKSGELVAGINQLYAGSAQLSKGTGLFTGGTEELKAGLEQLNSGLKELTKNNDQLNGGADQIVDGLVSAANAQIAPLAKELGINASIDKTNYEAQIDGIVKVLESPATKQAVSGKINGEIEKQKGSIATELQTGLVEAFKPQVTQAVLAQTDFKTVEGYQQAIKAGMVPEQVQAQIKATIEAKTAEAVTPILQAINKTATDKFAGLSAAKQQEVNAQLDGAVAQLKALKVQLKQVNQFRDGVAQYTAGVEKAAQGSEQLFAGSQQLAVKSKDLDGGAKQLNGGIGALKQGSGKLVDGVSELQKGSMTLSEGMSKFNEEGVKKIAKVLDGDLLNIGTRLRATSDVSKHYTNFSGIAKDTKGTVKFVYKTDEIQPKKEK